MAHSLYWHDYETFGIDPRLDRPAQFAGVRTDADFNIIDNPLLVYCKPPLDYLPDPEACFLTGITPQLAESKGVSEAEFCRLIHIQFAQSNTCNLGYNSIRFDDEFTRHCLYRNFYDPYAREWQNGNSRWDIIDVVRATQAFRPEGINWPVDAEGFPSFRLEELTKANGLEHEAAHDALSDVYATIALAKLISKAQPRLYQFLWRNRTKTEAYSLLQFGSYKPVVHVSGRYSNRNNCLAVVLPICKHPTNTNGIILYNLSTDPSAMLELSAEDIRRRIFTASADLPEGAERIPLKTVHLNKCPVLAPLNVLKTGDQDRLRIDLAACYRHLEMIKTDRDIGKKITEAFAKTEIPDSIAETDPDIAIYSGGFFPDADKQKMAAVRASSPGQLQSITSGFMDSRLTEMLFRYRARNFPETLLPEELFKWRQFCISRVVCKQANGGFVLDDYFARIQQLREKTAENTNLLDELELFGRNKMNLLGLTAK